MNDEGKKAEIVEYLKNAPAEVKKFLSSMMIAGSLGLKKVDNELFNAQSDDARSGDMEMEKHSNRFLDGLRKGQRNEQYVKYFYEVLRRADKFLYESSPDEIVAAMRKHNIYLDAEDDQGNIHEHTGFYDQKHKLHGKSLDEVRLHEMRGKTTTDDNYPVELMFNNKPTVLNFFEASQGLAKPQHDFPLKATRSNDVANKIEELTEFLHVKTLNIQNKILEFYIPNKFGLSKYAEGSYVYDELNSIEQIRFKDTYGMDHAYLITGFYKTSRMPNHDVVKYKATKIEQINFPI